jgi:cysteine desulfurase
MPTIYLDNAASTRPFASVIAEIARAHAEAWGNPSSAHGIGAVARERLAEARAVVLAAIGDPDGALGELVWTSGGSEGDALGVIGAARARGAGAIVVSALEHHAVGRSAELLANSGFAVRTAPATPAGAVDVAALAGLVDADTAVVAAMLVQNELGTLQPVAEVVRVVRARAPGCHVHCDAVQALGKVPVDVAALGVDSAAFAAHKLHGPKGVGALWVRHGARLTPLWGGGGQQGGLRSGTEDVAGAAGMAAAVARTVGDLAAAQARWAGFAAVLRAAAAASGVPFVELPERGERAPHVVPLAFRGVPAAALRNTLASRGVAVSAGSACAERDARPSAALTAIGLGPEWGVVRVSFGHDTTEADVAAGAAALAEAVADLGSP